MYQVTYFLYLWHPLKYQFHCCVFDCVLSLCCRPSQPGPARYISYFLSNIDLTAVSQLPTTVEPLQPWNSSGSCDTFYGTEAVYRRQNEYQCNCCCHVPLTLLTTSSNSRQQVNEHIDNSIIIQRHKQAKYQSVYTNEEVTDELTDIHSRQKSNF